MNKVSLKLFFILFILLCANGYSEINYRVSGRVIYNGVGVNEIRISVGYQSIYTNSDGSFYVYLSKGRYVLSIHNQKGYIRTRKNIVIKNKNITNILFFLKKGGSVSGSVKYQDGTPTIGKMLIFNKKGFGASTSTKIDENGEYIIKGILEGDEITLVADVFATPLKEINNISVREGEEVKNVNFVFPDKKITLSGKIQNIITKQSLKLEDGFSVIVMSRDMKSNPILISGLYNNKGKFIFYNLPKGKYNISVSAHDYKKKRFDIYINDINENKFLLIELEKK